MNATRRRAVVFACGMGSAAALAAWLRPGPADPAARLDLDRFVPERFGAWRADPIAAAFVRAADRRGAQVRLYDQVLERTFVNERGQRIMLSVAYGADQSADMQLHRPEVCYRAGGFEVGALRTDALALHPRALPVTRLVARLPGRHEPITYWAVVGGRLEGPHHRSVGERLARLTRRERGDGLLVRVSSIAADAESAWRTHDEFTQAMLMALGPAERARLTGAGAPP